MTTKTDLFTNIHKAIRTMLYDAGKRLQAVDFSDEAELKSILAHLDHVLDLLHEHAENEEKLIFPAVERVAPGVTDLAEAQHRDYENIQHQLAGQIEALRYCSDPQERRKMGAKLNQIYTAFLSFSLIHLNTEEETVLPASLEHLPDEELAAIRGRILASIPPDIHGKWMEYMLPSMNAGELADLFASMSTKAPAPVFESMKAFANAVVPPQRWKKVVDSLPVLQP